MKHFLEAFAQGQSLPRSVRMAREKLQGLEADYPCASWLPVIYQNPAEALTVWTQWQRTQVAEPSIQDAAATVTSSTARRSWRQPLFAIGLASLLVTGLIAGSRYLGWLQPWELQAFDHLMRLRPEEEPDSRLLVVVVTEADFQLPEQSQRRGSLSDVALEQLLQKLEPLQPQTIGLDIYRDFPADSTRSELAARLRRQSNVYATCKVSDRSVDHPGIVPPPEVPPERQGFSDIVKDPDGILRRHLMVMNPAPGSPCVAPYALSTQLALHYLSTQGRAAEYTNDTQELQIGDVRFGRLQQHKGGYQTVDTWGYQTLLNYRATRSLLDIAPSITLTELLNGQAQAAQVKDKIVLIGVTAASAGDFVATPYRVSQTSNQLPGVFVQAHMVSQILSAVENRRPLLQTWPYWGDLLWVGVWATVGGSLAWYCRSPIYLLLMAIALAGLAIACLGFLVYGLWVPLIPAGLTFVLAGASVTAYRALPQPVSDRDRPYPIPDKQ